MSESASKDATHLATSTSGAVASDTGTNGADSSSSLSTHGVTELIGKSIDGRYEILEKLGSGGMGAVYKAEHTLMGRTVAIKVLHPHLVENEDLLKRFQQEARVASKLDHPNAIQTYDFGIYKSAPYLVMEYVEGRTLKDLVEKEGPLTVARMKSIFVQVCSALAQAHGLGIIHRDLKPENIMLVKKPNGVEEAMVVDFGIAKLLNEQGEQNRAVMTQVGTFFGTPKYASPEQAVERRVDKRSDIYTLGVILYEVLSGKVPFDAPSVVEILMRHVNTMPVPLRKFRPEMKIPQEVDDLVMKCLQKKADQRYQSVEELQTALEAIQTASPYKKFIIGGAAVATAAAIAAGIIFTRDDDSHTIQIADSGPAAKTEANVPAVLDSSKSDPNLPPTKKEKRSSNPLIAMVFTQALKQLHSEPPKEAPVPPVDDKLFDNPDKLDSEASEVFSEASSAMSAYSSEPTAIALNEPPETERGVDVQESSQSSSSELSVEQAEALRRAELAHTQVMSADSPVTDPPANESQVIETPPIVDTPVIPPPPKSDDLIAMKKDIATIEAGKKEAGKLYTAGRDLYKQRRYAEAAAKFEKAISYRSDAVGSYISLGNCYMRLNQLEKAKQAYSSAVAVEPSYGPAHYGLAGYYAGAGQKDLAIQSLRKALDLDSRARSFAESDPDFAPLREMPEFRKLVR